MTDPEHDSPSTTPTVEPPRWLFPRLVSKVSPANAVLALIIISALAGVHIREVYVGQYWPTRLVHFAAIAVEARLLKVILGYVGPFLPSRATRQSAAAEQDAS